MLGTTLTLNSGAPRWRAQAPTFSVSFVRITHRVHLLTLLSILGWGMAAYFMWKGGGARDFDAHAYWAAGRNLLAGAPIYGGALGGHDAFFYAPTFAVVFAPLSLLPASVFYAAVVMAGVLGLRYVAGSWRNAGLVFVAFPPIALELLLGNINFLVAAAVVAAFRRSTGPVAAVALAKLYPGLLLPQLWRQHRSLRPLLAVIVASVVLTLPVLHLWPEWAATIVASLSHPSGANTLASPMGALRYPVCALLLVVGYWKRLDWLAAAGAVVVMPYWAPSTVAIALGPLRLLVDDLAGRAGKGAPALPQ